MKIKPPQPIHPPTSAGHTAAMVCLEGGTVIPNVSPEARATHPQNTALVFLQPLSHKKQSLQVLGQVVWAGAFVVGVGRGLWDGDNISRYAPFLLRPPDIPAFPVTQTNASEHFCVLL